MGFTVVVRQNGIKIELGSPVSPWDMREALERAHEEANAYEGDAKVTVLDENQAEVCEVFPGGGKVFSDGDVSFEITSNTSNEVVVWTGGDTHVITRGKEWWSSLNPDTAGGIYAYIRGETPGDVLESILTKAGHTGFAPLIEEAGLYGDIGEED